jgi:very-short-patch-repair endonuclease
MKTCENCSSLNNGNYGSGRFCSSTCARGFSTKNKRAEINEKVSKKLTGYYFKSDLKLEKTIKIKVQTDRHCKYCNSVFYFRKKTNEFCSNTCSAKFRTLNKQYIQKLSDAANNNIANGTHQGWQSRKVRSYAELFFEDVLRNNNLFDRCSVEHKIKKSDLGLNCSMNYFMDFYFPELKLDLEIDGKQHEYKERKESDRVRDEALSKNGITVYRIKWKNPNTEENKEYIKNEIEKFLNYYNGALVYRKARTSMEISRNPNIREER